MDDGYTQEVIRLMLLFIKTFYNSIKLFVSLFALI